MLMSSCGPGEEPVRPPPPAPQTPPPPSPREPAASPRSFEGTWLTDQGALIIREEKFWGETQWLGSFLPFRLPCAFFRGAKTDAVLSFRDLGDQNLRWNGSLNLSDDGGRLRGSVSIKGSAESFPCEGRRIGSSNDGGVPALIEALGHEDAWIRRCAADALGALGPPARDAIPELVRALGDDDRDVPRHASVALTRLGAASSSKINALACHLRDGAASVRRGAAEVLGRSGEPAAGALSELLNCLEDSDGAVRATSLDSIVRIGRASPQALTRALRALDPAQVGIVEQALRGTDPLLETERESPEHDWPQWRGPRKDNVSRETGLLQEWPEGGPPIVWEVWGIGDGIAAPSVSAGRIFILGFLNGWEYLTALEAATGTSLWSARLGPGSLENSHMRWVSQRTPTADAERVYAYLNSGQLVCLRARDGVEQWRIDYSTSFGGRFAGYGYTDHPILDGDRLLCTPASEKVMVAAVDRRTGKILWTSRVTGDESDSAPSTILTELSGVRQIVVKAHGLHGFAADNGRFLWTSQDVYRDDRDIVQTPIAIPGSGLLARTSWNKLALLTSPPQVAYLWNQRFGWLHDSNLLLDAFYYVARDMDLERLTVDPGTEDRWKIRHELGTASSMTCADGRLYVLGSDGIMALVELTEEMRIRSSFRIPMFVKTSGTTNPVVAQGRLIVRDSDRLLCYDLRAARTARGGAALRNLDLSAPPLEGSLRAAFVSTPHDIVEQMLDLSRLQASEVLVDLGSGDGRILLAAARRDGVKAVGYEIDAALVDRSRQAAAAAGLSARVRIEQQDFFRVDLSGVDVVALYLPEELLTRLKPQLHKLRPGARVVSHQFRIPGWKADREMKVSSSEDKGDHLLYLYQIRQPEGK
jgi:outer membrane protein assembly factor BamB